MGKKKENRKQNRISKFEMKGKKFELEIQQTHVFFKMKGNVVERSC